MECVIVAWIRAMVVMAHFRLRFDSTHSGHSAINVITQLNAQGFVLSVVPYYI